MNAWLVDYWFRIGCRVGFRFGACYGGLAAAAIVVVGAVADVGPLVAWPTPAVAVLAFVVGAVVGAALGLTYGLGLAFVLIPVSVAAAAREQAGVPAAVSATMAAAVPLLAGLLDPGWWHCACPWLWPRWSRRTAR